MGFEWTKQKAVKSNFQKNEITFYQQQKNIYKKQQQIKNTEENKKNIICTFSWLLALRSSFLALSLASLRPDPSSWPYFRPPRAWTHFADWVLSSFKRRCKARPLAHRWKFFYFNLPSVQIHVPGGPDPRSWVSSSFLGAQTHVVFDTSWSSDPRSWPCSRPRGARSQIDTYSWRLAK